VATRLAGARNSLEIAGGFFTGGEVAGAESLTFHVVRPM
jgi:hypothetical protein